jgi:hypothetical protein
MGWARLQRLEHQARRLCRFGAAARTKGSGLYSLTARGVGLTIEDLTSCFVCDFGVIPWRCGL